jgi:hypothetical protein
MMLDCGNCQVFGAPKVPVPVHVCGKSCENIPYGNLLNRFLGSWHLKVWLLFKVSVLHLHIISCFTVLKMAEAPAIGIDLGTTYSRVAVFRHGEVEIITNDAGNNTMPSYVSFTDTAKLIGCLAKDELAINPNNTIVGMSKL